jgi:hypothetical protein
MRATDMLATVDQNLMAGSVGVWYYLVKHIKPTHGYGAQLQSRAALHAHRAHILVQDSSFTHTHTHTMHDS